jgi:hypothetical protein
MKDLKITGKIQVKTFKLSCCNCQKEVVPYLFENGPHIEADCPDCLTCIKFLNKKEKRHVNISLKQGGKPQRMKRNGFARKKRCAHA